MMVLQILSIGYESVAHATKVRERLRGLIPVHPGRGDPRIARSDAAIAVGAIAPSLRRSRTLRIRRGRARAREELQRAARNCSGGGSTHAAEARPVIEV